VAAGRSLPSILLSYASIKTNRASCSSGGRGGRIIKATEDVDEEEEVIRVEPLSTTKERWKAPHLRRHPARRPISCRGWFPPFDPETGEVRGRTIFERQDQVVLAQ